MYQLLSIQMNVVVVDDNTTCLVLNSQIGKTQVKLKVCSLCGELETHKCIFSHVIVTIVSTAKLNLKNICYEDLMKK